MKIRTYLHRNADVAITVLVAIVLYLWIFTAQSLSPSNINLVMKGGDLAQNYLGGALYRSEALSWDLFAMKSVQYPEVSSAVQTDSSPLISFIFKLLKPFGFKAEYQYFGIWILFNFIMIAIFSALLFRRIFNERNNLFAKHAHVKNTILIVVSSTFFICAPIFLTRAFAHVNLTAQWFILAALFLYVQNTLRLKIWLFAAVLLFCTIGIHPYFAAMILPLFMALALKKMLHKEISISHFLCGLLFLIAVALFAMFCFHLYGNSDVRTGFGWHQANLNTFINPHNNESLFIPRLGNVNTGEWEGAAYLGLGLIVLELATCWYAIKHAGALIVQHKEMFVVLICIALFAVSNNIYWGETKLLEINLPEGIINICHTLRSSGRFVWVIWYVLVLSSIYFATKIFKNKVLYVLPILLCVQIIDLQPLFNEKRDFIRKYSQQEYSNQFENAEWNSLFQQHEHVVLPPFKARNAQLYRDVWFQAVKHNFTVNTGYLTLKKQKAIEQAEWALNEVMQGKMPQLGYAALYILPQNIYDKLAQKAETDSAVNRFVSNLRESNKLHYFECK